MVKKQFLSLEASSLGFLNRGKEYLFGGEQEGRSEVAAVIIEDGNDASS